MTYAFFTMQKFSSQVIGLLFLIFVANVDSKAESISGDTSLNSQTLENLAFQADYIALVRLPSIPVDSLPYFVHDLGTNHYQASFEPIKVFKQSIPMTENWYSFIHHGYDKPGPELYRAAELCYIFLSNGLPKSLGNRDDLRSTDAYSNQPSLLIGGLIPASSLNTSKIKRLTKFSHFAKAARDGNTRKMKRIAKRELNQLPNTDFSNWLLNQQGIDGSVIDTCVDHIAIWPGWMDYYFWINTLDGLKEYELTIQNGTMYRVPFRMPRFMTEKNRLKSVEEVPGARKAVQKHCEQRRIWDAQDVYNNLVQLRLDEGRLNWSVYGAPQHLDSDEPIIRAKLSLYNRGDSAMFLRWTNHHSQGRKLIQFVLQNEETHKIYRELNGDISLFNQAFRKYSDTLVISEGNVETWHSINDPFVEYADATAAHRFDSLPDGAYRVHAVYDPYPEATKDTVSWNPYCDSISAHAGYVFRVNSGNRTHTRIRAQVVQSSEIFVNNYDQTGYTNGCVKVLESPSNSTIQIGDTIAWKLLISPEILNRDDFRPPYTHELLQVGDTVQLDLVITPTAYDIETASGKYRIFGTPERLDAVVKLD